MKTILETIYFRSNGTERDDKVLKAKKDIVNYLCKEELTISECYEVLSAIKAYIEEAETQTLDSSPIKYLLSKDI